MYVYLYVYICIVKRRTSTEVIVVLVYSLVAQIPRATLKGNNKILRLIIMVQNQVMWYMVIQTFQRRHRNVYIYTGYLFLIVVLFDKASCLYFSPDFIHRPLIFFVRLCAIEWGIDHNSIIAVSRVIRRCVNGQILKKMIFNRFWRNFQFFEYSNKT